MTYEAACEALYNDRLALKSKQEQSRRKFRKSVLDRQNNQHYAPIRTKNTSEVVVDFNFVMPDILPADEMKLKWLIFQNIELIQKIPERKQEGQANIKRIKSFVNEQKERSELPA